MTISGMRRKLLLGSGLALSGLLGYGRSVEAACVVTVSPNYQCSGTEVTTQSILNVDNAAVTTAADFSVIAAAGNGIEITGEGAISFTDIHVTGDRSIISGASNGLSIHGLLSLSVGSVTVNTNGTISGSSNGIYASGFSAGGALSVTTGEGNVLGGNRGIDAQNHGTGALSVTTGAGDVTGTAGYGIYAHNFSSGTSLTVTTGDGAVLGGERGIHARNYGDDALSVTTGAGAVTGTGATSMGIFAENAGTATNLTVSTGDGDILAGNSGIYAHNSGTGALLVTTGDGDVTGTAGIGINARKEATGIGNLTVTTGDGDVLGGDGGISAINGGNGVVSVTTGAGDVTGTASIGIDARNYGTGTDVNVTTGDGAVLGGIRGIHALNLGTGAISVTTGDGAVTGTVGYGIYAKNDLGTSVSVTTGDGDVYGGSGGILAYNFTAGALSVTTGAGDVTGESDNGIIARNVSTGTSLTVTTGDGDVYGGDRGITASNFGTGALSVTTGLGAVTGTEEYGINALNDAGTSLTVTTGDGDVTGGNMGIRAIQNGSGDFSITVGGLVSNVALDDAGEAVKTLGNGVMLETLAAGNITGRITTAVGVFDDTFNNAGLWISNGTSDFSGGANQINNSGTVRSANTANTAEVTSFANAGIFTNLAGGLLTLVDEAASNGSTAHDQLTIFGNFAGGGTLAVDASLGGPGSTADVLTIEGDITGVTAVVVNNTNAANGALNADGITIVTYAGTAADGAFVLANGPVSAGLFAYDLQHDSGIKIFELVSTGISVESEELATFVSAAQTIWHDTSGVLGDRFEELRGDTNGAAVVGETLVQPVSYRTAANAGLWGKVLGRTSDRDASSTLSYGLDVTGFIAGVDGVVNESVAGGVLALGVTGGYVAAWQDFNSGSKADYEGFSGGLYATYLNGGFRLDSEFRANFLDLDYSMVATPTSDADVTSLGGSVEAGYRIDMTDSFYAEPVARLAYVDTTIRNGDVLGVEFDGDGESFRGAVGLNLGGILNGGADIVFRPELSAKVWSEFDGNNSAAFSGFTVSDDTPETYGEVGLSLEAVNLSNGWSGHFNTDIQFANDFTSYGGFVGLTKSF